MSVTGFSDADWAESHNDRRFTLGYCTFVGGNLVTWRSKKQHVVARSSVEAKYRAMSHTTSEMLWVQSFLREMRIEASSPMEMYCDNKVVMFIASNPMFHKRTKHIEVDCHFIPYMIMQKQIVTLYVKSKDQLGDIFTKLGMCDVYTLA